MQCICSVNNVNDNEEMKDIVGRATWVLLHNVAKNYKDVPTFFEKQKMINFIDGLSHIYPCNKCALHFRQHIVLHPPTVNSKNELSEWFCNIHNKINISQGKSVYDCSKLTNKKTSLYWF